MPTTLRVEFDLPIKPPIELFGIDTSSQWWPVVQASVPRAHDVFVPPGGKVALVLAGANRMAGGAFNAMWLNQELLVFELHDGKVGRELYRESLASGNAVVMVEWALGRNVTRWDRALRAWAIKGLLPPVIIPASNTSATGK